jgi:hypothetical protein
VDVKVHCVGRSQDVDDDVLFVAVEDVVVRGAAGDHDEVDGDEQSRTERRPHLGEYS